MRFWRRSLSMAAMAMAIAAGIALPARAAGGGYFPPQLDVGDTALYQRAFGFVATGAWDEALALAAQAESPLAGKVIQWLYVSGRSTGASFAEIAAFLDANPHWPATSALEANAEAALVDGHSDDDTAIAWFTHHPPLIGAGMAWFAASLAARGRQPEALAWARKAWTGASLDFATERALRSGFGGQFSAADDAARAEWLLWRGLSGEAERMLESLADGERRLAVARIWLRQRRGGVDARIDAVPEEFRDDPRLVYERVRWRQLAGDIGGAASLLLDLPAQSGPEWLWWEERELLAREALGYGDAATAYAVVRAHGQSGRTRLSEAEWLAGWLALTALDDPESAYLHFGRQQAVVRTPVSLARAAYWAGRAAAAIGEAAVARSWYEEAARFPTTFYGQMAMAALPGADWIRLPPDPAPTLAEADRIAANELSLVCILLAELGQGDRMRPFLDALFENAAGAGEIQVVLRLAAVLGRRDASVSMAKIALRDGLVLPEAGWPLTPEAQQSRAIEPALVLAVIRQESEFDAGAISPAGARGLMQLMPATARSVAAAIRVGYEPGRLVGDAAYNVRLGASHLAELVESFDGSYVLAIAAYNAGASRVRRWIQEFGDPRDADVDVIDWIERIPFPETRNYVQRVVENLGVYRAVLAGGAAPLTITADLARSR
ncbi:MAG: lytic transglycosylase domain-containing protein [Proteobacteria bacterium]|nr:lytic transglycosylase domain-containing protein [Pseudomonadota bacterium]